MAMARQYLKAASTFRLLVKLVLMAIYFVKPCKEAASIFMVLNLPKLRLGEDLRTLSSGKFNGVLRYTASGTTNPLSI